MTKLKKILLSLVLLSGLALSSLVGYLPTTAASTDFKFSPGVVFIKPNDNSQKTVSLSLIATVGGELTVNLAQAYSESAGSHAGPKYLEFKDLPRQVVVSNAKPATINFSVPGSYQNNDFNQITADGVLNGKTYKGAFSVRISDDPPGTRTQGEIVFVPSSLTLDNPTDKKEVKLSLDTDPKGPVTIRITSPVGETGIVTFSKTSFDFTSANYQSTQSLTVQLNPKVKNSKTVLVLLSGSNVSTYFETYFDVTAPNNALEVLPEQIDLSKVPGLSNLKLEGLVPRLIGLFLTIIALAAFASLIYSGLMYITAGGDTGKAEKARKNIVWAFTGILLALFAYVIVAAFGSIK